MEDVMGSNRLFVIIAVVGLIFASATVLLGVYKRQNKILKYLPAIIAAVVSLGFLIKTFMFSEGFEALGYLIMMMISAAVFGISIITALVLEIINRRHK
jgi:hypothetical protein